jgi:hypothetical protein
MKVDQTREAVTMKVAEKRRWKILVVAGATMALVAGMVSTLPSAYAGGTIKIDDDHWVSIGMGIRTKLSSVQNGQANGQGYGTDFGVDNARVYINARSISTSGSHSTPIALTVIVVSPQVPVAVPLPVLWAYSMRSGSSSLMTS